MLRIALATATALVAMSSAASAGHVCSGWGPWRTCQAHAAPRPATPPRIVAPPQSSLIQNNGGRIISHNGGNVIGQNGAGIVAGNTSRLISDNGAVLRHR